VSDAGKYKHRVQFDRAVDVVDDDTGERERVWELLMLAYARVQPLRGREALIADGVESEADTLITTRYSRLLMSMRPKDRAYFAVTDTYYNVVSVRDVDSAHVDIEFRCTSGLNAG